MADPSELERLRGEVGNLRRTLDADRARIDAALHRVRRANTINTAVLWSVAAVVAFGGVVYLMEHAEQRAQVQQEVESTKKTVNTF